MKVFQRRLFILLISVLSCFDCLAVSGDGNKKGGKKNAIVAPSALCAKYAWCKHDEGGGDSGTDSGQSMLIPSRSESAKPDLEQAALRRKQGMRLRHEHFRRKLSVPCPGGRRVLKVTSLLTIFEGDESVPGDLQYQAAAIMSQAGIRQEDFLRKMQSSMERDRRVKEGDHLLGIAVIGQVLEEARLEQAQEKEHRVSGVQPVHQLPVVSGRRKCCAIL